MLKKIALLLIILSFGCTQVSNDDKIGIVVTIPPLQEFANAVGGNKIDVSVMVPAGASPHSYEPTPSQLKKVSNAGIYVKIGTPIEFEILWNEKLISLNEDMVVIDSSKGIELIETEQENGGIDPHIWTSPSNAVIIIENIYQGLVKADPANKDYYKARKDRYQEKLNGLIDEIEDILSEKKNSEFMVYHPAWGYLAHEFNLTEIPIEKGGKEPSAKDIEQVIEHALESNITVIFASPQFNTESAQVISDEIDGRVVLIDPLDKTYIENLRKVAKAFADAMD